MEMEELGDEAGPQEQAKTVESMDDVGIDKERPTSTTTEAVPQELVSPVELAEQSDNMATMEVDPRQASMDEAVDMVTEGTPQGSPATMELMEEVMTTPTIEPME